MSQPITNTAIELPQKGEIMEHRTVTLNVSVLLLRGESGWVAQCLHYDLAAQASTFTGAQEAIARTIASQVVVDIEHNQEPLATFAPAPKEYWDS